MDSLISCRRALFKDKIVALNYKKMTVFKGHGGF